ncbi:MAG: glycosyltransferase, partial [Muribaculaceae bacterium]|nr:glycosyltransferase [Muribaculaceae bacterium]
MLTYNQQEYIARAIEGVIMQRVDFGVELIVADDCSSDDTRCICREYAARYPGVIRLIENKVNKGLVDNYFDTVMLASGKYIADCAGDDYWDDPDRLQRQVDRLEADQSAVLAYTNYRRYYENSGDWNNDFYATSGLALTDRLTYDAGVYDLIGCRGAMAAYLGTSCFRADVFKGLYSRYTSYFRNREYGCEDFQILFLMLREGDFLYDSRPTAVYRVRESVSHSSDVSRTLKYYMRSLIMKSDFIRDFGLDVSRCAAMLIGYALAILSMSIVVG